MLSGSRVVTINPCKIKKGQQKLFYALLQQKLMSIEAKQELSKKGETQSGHYEITCEGETYHVSLTHSISKVTVKEKVVPFVRTKEVLGGGAFGTVKMAGYSLMLDDEAKTVDSMPGTMVYKRIHSNQRIVQKLIIDFQDLLNSNETNFFQKLILKQIIEEIKQNGRKKTQEEWLKLLNRLERYEITIKIRTQKIIKGFDESKSLFKQSEVGIEVDMLKRIRGISSNLIVKESSQQYYSAHFFLPLVPGESLDKKIKSKKKPSLAEWLTMARQLHHDLGTMHQQGIIHDDISPRNIMCNIKGPLIQTRLIDFGVAHHVNEKPRMAAGDLNAPERKKNEQISSFATDVYSTGLVILLAFRDDYELILEDISESHCKKDKSDQYLASAVTLALADVPTFYFNPLKEIFLKNLNKNPDERLSAQQTEMCYALLGSGLFHDFQEKKLPKEKNAILDKLNETSLQDLYYFLTLVSNPEEYKICGEIVFGQDNNLIQTVLEENKTGLLPHLFHTRVKTQLETLKQQLIGCDIADKKDEKSQAIKQLIEYIHAQQVSYKPQDLPTIAKYIEEILWHSIAVQQGKLVGSWVITQIFKVMDPFILEYVEPVILDKAYALRAGSLVSHFKQRQHGEPSSVTSKPRKQFSISSGGE